MGCRRDPFCVRGRDHDGKCSHYDDDQEQEQRACVVAPLARIEPLLETGHERTAPVADDDDDDLDFPPVLDAAECDEDEDSDNDDVNTCTALIPSGTEGVVDLSVPVPSGVLSNWEEHEAYASSVIPRVRGIDSTAVEGEEGDEQSMGRTPQQPCARWRHEMPDGWQPWPAELRERLCMMGEKLEMLDERLLDARQQWTAEYVGEAAVAKRGGDPELPPEALYGQRRIEEQAARVEVIYLQLVRAVRLTASDPELQAMLTRAEDAAAEDAEERAAAAPEQQEACAWQAGNAQAPGDTPSARESEDGQHNLASSGSAQGQEGCVAC